LANSPDDTDSLSTIITIYDVLLLSFGLDEDDLNDHMDVSFEQLCIDALVSRYYFFQVVISSKQFFSFTVIQPSFSFNIARI
jgi:hypothetical protein